jgi:hypothetical protein
VIPHESRKPLADTRGQIRHDLPAAYRPPPTRGAPAMTWWLIGDEESEDQRFRAVPGGFGLYHAAGSWCMGQIRGVRDEQLPIEWFIPDHWIKGWPSGARIAQGLESVGLFKRISGEPGYRYGWIRQQNTVAHVREMRRREREKKRGQRGGDS